MPQRDKPPFTEELKRSKMTNPAATIQVRSVRVSWMLHRLLELCRGERQ